MTTYRELLERAARLCSTSEKCSSEIREKLIAWGMAEEDTVKALDYLEKNNFVDDRRYTEYYVKDKLKFNRWGRIKIRYALQQKNLKNEVITQALDSIDPDEYEQILNDVITRKANQLTPINDPKKKARLIRYAAQKGFTSEEIYRAIGSLETGD
jgi:regulatory protein